MTRQASEKKWFAQEERFPDYTIQKVQTLKMTVVVGIVFLFNHTTHESQSLQKQKRRTTDYLEMTRQASEQKLLAHVERFPEYTLEYTIQKVYTLKMTVVVGIVFLFNNATHESQSLQKQTRRTTDYLEMTCQAYEQKLFAQVERFPEYALEYTIQKVQTLKMTVVVGIVFLFNNKRLESQSLQKQTRTTTDYLEMTCQASEQKLFALVERFPEYTFEYTIQKVYTLKMTVVVGIVFLFNNATNESQSLQKQNRRTADYLEMTRQASEKKLLAHVEWSPGYTLEYTIQKVYTLKMTFVVGIVFLFNNATHESQSLQKQTRRTTDYLEMTCQASEQKLFAQVERFPEYTLEYTIQKVQTLKMTVVVGIVFLFNNTAHEQQSLQKQKRRTTDYLEMTCQASEQTLFSQVHRCPEYTLEYTKQKVQTLKMTVVVGIFFLI